MELDLEPVPVLVNRAQSPAPFPPISEYVASSALHFEPFPTGDWFHNSSQQAEYLTGIGFDRGQIIDMFLSADTPADFLKIPKEEAMRIMHMHEDTEDRFDNLCAFLRQLYPQIAPTQTTDN